MQKFYHYSQRTSTHERSWNEDCILHVRIPFFNWVYVFLYIDWKITLFFRWTKSILRTFQVIFRNRLHGALGRSANQLLQGCHPLSRIFTSTRKWLSRRVDWIVSDDFMNSSFWHSRVRVSEHSGTPRNTSEHTRNTPEHTRNTPEHPRNSLRTAWNTLEHPGTPRNTLEHPIMPRNTLNTARNTLKHQ